MYPKFKRSIGPVVEKTSIEDGAFINKHPLHIITEGSYNKVPLMMGYTSREAFFLTAGSQKLSKKDKIYINFERYIPNFVDVEIGSKLSKNIAEKLKKFYFGDIEQIVENRDRYYLVCLNFFYVYENCFFFAPEFFYSCKATRYLFGEYTVVLKTTC